MMSNVGIKMDKNCLYFFICQNILNMGLMGAENMFKYWNPYFWEKQLKIILWFRNNLKASFI